MTACRGSAPQGDPDAGHPSDQGTASDLAGYLDVHGIADDPGKDPGDTSVREVDDAAPLTCRTCVYDTECRDGYLCLPVGSASFCLMECETANDCPPSFLCYHSHSAGHTCLPISYNCVPCISDSPCEPGKCCDFVSGECKDCRDQCQTCAYDFDCREGHRCLKQGAATMGVCVDGCRGGAACPEGFTCGVNPAGVEVCLPDNPDDCRGCPVGSHIRGDGACVQCLNSSHCDQDEHCDPTLHRCLGECGIRVKCDDGLCHDCCDDSDCRDADDNDTGPCLDGECENSVVDCRTYCPGPHGCTMIDGKPVCFDYQCLRDEDCPLQGCRCSGPPLYACAFQDGSVCALDCPATCASGDDCPVLASGPVLDCHLGFAGTGICFDPAGSCDGYKSCCAPGQTCFDFDLIVSFLASLGLPLEAGLSGGACTCSDEHPCLGDGVCTPTSTLCDLEHAGPSLCPDGVPPSWLPAALCMDLAAMLTEPSP